MSVGRKIWRGIARWKLANLADARNFNNLAEKLVKVAARKLDP